MCCNSSHRLLSSLPRLLLALIGAATLVAVAGGVIHGEPASAEAADPSGRANGATAESEPPGQPPGRYTSVRRLPGQTTVATLDNGLTVIVQENHVAPVATVRCYVNNTGSAFEGEYLGAGLSHVLEHVVSGGTTEHRTEKEIEKAIDTIGGATNAYTSTDVTAYYIDCPAKNVELAVELLADMMQHCAFAPDEFARELAVIRRELADGQVNRRRVQWNLLKQTLYTKHPIRYPTIGYLDVLNQTTNEAIIDFYRSRYVPNNQVFVVVGDVRTDAVLDQVAREWAATPHGFETLVVMPEEPEQLAPREVVREMDGATYDFVLAWPTVKLSHADLYALDVASYILSQGDSSRLAMRLKHDEPLALSIDTASYTPHFAKGFFAVFGSAPPDTWQQAVDGALDEVYRLRDDLVSPEELAKAKKQKAAELVFDRQTAEQAAERLGQNLLSTADPLFDDTYVENIQKVTAEQVRQVARRYFNPLRLNRVLIAPPDGAPQSASGESTGAESDVQMIRLDNGLRVLLKRHTHLPLVNIEAYSLGAALVDTEETAGRASLVGQMLSRGTPDYSAEEIAAWFDSVGGQFSTAAGRNTVYASATVLKDDFPKAAELFAQCLLQPTFPEDEFRKVKRLALGAIARRADDPASEALELFLDNLPAASPYHIVQGGKKETVEEMTVDQLRQYHQKYFVPQNMVVTIFGDIDPDEARATAERLFGQLPADPSFKPISFDRPNEIAKSITRHKQTGKPTGLVLLGYEGTSIRDADEYAALTVLDAITSGYGYPGGWLHNELRGAGLVYYVHAFQITGPAPGFFAVQAQTQPDAVDEVVRRIRANIEKAKQGDISREEFERAKKMVIAMHAQDNTTIAGQARQSALDELYGLGYDYDESFDERINAVTLEEVIAVAREKLGNSVLVTTSPRAE